MRKQYVPSFTDAPKPTVVKWETFLDGITNGLNDALNDFREEIVITVMFFLLFCCPKNDQGRIK